MAGGDGIEEQALADDITAARVLWEERSVNFLQVLEELAATNIDLNLPDPNISIFLGGFFAEMQAEIQTKPDKPAGIDYAAPTEPGDAPAIATPAIETVNIPSLDATAPLVNIPLAPELDTLAAPTAPVLRTVVPPDSPVVILPDAPVITAVQFPDEAVVELPTFTQSFPLEPDLLITQTTFDYSEDIVATPILDQVEAKTSDDLTNGGYGIEPDDEQALYDRVRDRETQASISEQESELRTSASRGFALPPGVAQQRLDSARQAARERISEANREISTNRAELFRKTRESSLTRGVAIEAERLQYHGFRMERALNGARFAAEFSINVFDAQVRRYNAQLVAYQAFISGYAAQIQSELAKVEIFKIEVEAAVAQQRAKQIEVELYTALVNSQTVRVQLFETQVRAAALEMEIERTKMESFRTEVQAFAELIKGQALELAKFDAQIKAETTKVSVFATQVAAFKSQVDAAQVETAVRNRDVELSIETSRLELQGYQEEIRRYVALVSGESARVAGLVSEYTADTSVYSSAIAGWGSLSGGAIEEGRTLVGQLNANLNREQTNAQIDLMGQTRELANRLNATTAGVNVSREIVTALQGTINVISGKVTA
jgi:hypothetical protein